MTCIQPTSASEIGSLVRQTLDRQKDFADSKPEFRVRGGGTKPLLWNCPTDHTLLDMSGLSGIVEYQPGEFTITVKAATPLAEIQTALNENDQFMPFDPPLIEQGATIGGTIAAGLSGPGQFRFGSLRDYVLHMCLIDGLGALCQVGGKVVKNAAGFDIPKLMVGSLGRLAVMTEVTLKVFPSLPQRATMAIECQSFSASIELMYQLSGGGLGLEAIELLPAEKTILIRIVGTQQSIERLQGRVIKICGQSEARCTVQSECQHWDNWHQWTDPDESERLIKIPMSPRSLGQIEEFMAEHGVQRHYSVAGNIAWIHWPQAKATRCLEAFVDENDLSGIIMRGGTEPMRFGKNQRNVFSEKIKSAMDPHNLFGSLNLST